MAVILEFGSERFYLFLLCKTPRCYLPSFKSVGFSVQKKKRKINFQDGRHLGSDWNDFNYVLLYKTRRFFLPSFKSVGFLVQKKKRKKDFQDSSRGGHLGFPIGNNLATFDLKFTLMRPTKIQVNWPFGSAEAKKRFSRWRP